MSRTLNTLIRWCPGPRSTGTIAETSNWKVYLPAGTGPGVDGETALRAWKRGKLDVDTSARIAALCSDGEALVQLLKDRRVAVRMAVLRNPNCPWDLLAQKAHWGGNEETSYSVRNVARNTLETALHRAEFSTVLAWLRDGLPRVAFEVAGKHPRINDAELLTFASSTFKDIQGNTVEMLSLAAGRRLDGHSDATLLKLASLGPSAAHAVAGCAAQHGREQLALGVLALADSATERDFQGRRIAQVLSSGEGMSKEFFTTLYRWFEKHGAWLPSELCLNKGADWRLWNDQKANDANVNAIGKAVAELWGDDPAVWRFAAEMVDTMHDATIGEIIALLEITHPRA